MFSWHQRPGGVASVRVWLAVAMATCWAGSATLAIACPFCTAQSLTLSEEINANEVAVLARLDELPSGDVADPVGAKAKFQIVEVLKGDAHVRPGQQIEVLYFGQDETGTMCYLIGNDVPNINWSTPIALSQRAVDYIRRLPKLPESGPDRLAFFQEYFEDSEELLARDAYDEFARAPYAELVALKDRMHHDRLVQWIRDPQVPASRRRLYLTMLGVCGTADDVAMLEKMIASDNRETKRALDALVACYLTLKGPEGLPLVEDLFLKNHDAEYVDTYATIQALRFIGQEQQEKIPRARLTQSMRYMLDRPELADLVIPDLARWEDWSVVDQLVELFKKSDDDSSWVRVPVINYLRACPLPEAKQHLEELAKLDPDAMKRANSFFPFAAAAPAAKKATRAGAEAAKTASGGDAAAESPPADASASKGTKAAPTTTATTGDGEPAKHSSSPPTEDAAGTPASANAPNDKAPASDVSDSATATVEAAATKNASAGKMAEQGGRDTAVKSDNAPDAAAATAGVEETAAAEKEEGGADGSAAAKTGAHVATHQTNDTSGQQSAEGTGSSAATTDAEQAPATMADRVRVVAIAVALLVLTALAVGFLLRGARRSRQAAA